MIQPIGHNEYSNKVVQVHEHTCIHVYDSTMTLLRTAYVTCKRRIRLNLMFVQDNPSSVESEVTNLRFNLCAGNPRIVPASINPL